MINSLLLAMARTHDVLTKNTNNWRFSIIIIFRLHCKMKRGFVDHRSKFDDGLLAGFLQQLTHLVPRISHLPE